MKADFRYRLSTELAAGWNAAIPGVDERLL
jgi:hypothetical protein